MAKRKRIGAAEASAGGQSDGSAARFLEGYLSELKAGR